ncbi:ankyrin repeat and SOCS box protein 3-like [Asterias rubens]|uniref:ankyrin repeat and SOCS box protein 3-like n=1 Tax=Asterias rubens TaxID=7604 RepID=UPI001455A5EE|nr:ankyrin repeat and SOCS box protein 3-like [Asterias rubens]XP_033646538.1 ankyrin repeat and SOCS box protein 3-like [Asterias rubens]
MDSTEGDPDCSSVSAAARVGDSESLQQLIVNGSCIDVQDSRGWTALHEAAKANHCDCVKILLEHIEDEKDVNVVTLQEETALLFAAQNGNKEMIEQLLQHGADLDIFDMREIYPLHAAVEGNHRECVELLLKNGASVNCTDGNGFSSLHKAAYSGCVDMVKFLLESGAEIDVHCYHEFTPMYAAALNGYLDCLKLLVEHGADINITTDDATPLYTAAKENHPDCVEHLLEQGASITISRAVDSTDDESLELAPIHIAAGKGHMTCLKLLLPVSLGMLQDDYIDFDKELQTPMHLAAKKGHIKVIKALLKAGCGPDFGLVDFPKYYRKKLRASQPVTLGAMYNLQSTI